VDAYLRHRHGYSDRCRHYSVRGDKSAPLVAAVIAAATMAVVGSYCGILCNRIDVQFGYFGGPENTTLFVLAGTLSAIFGGLFYGWLVYFSPKNRTRVS
jgi:hypothetical protein